MPARPITSNEIATFERDGVVHLPGVHPQEWVDRLRRSMDEVFARSQPTEDAHGTVSGLATRGDRTDMVDLVNRLVADRPGIDVAVDGNAAPTGRSLVETDAASWHDELRRHHVESPLGDVVATLTGSKRVNLYADQLFCKEPGSAVRTPWHQDKPYFLLQGDRVAVCWVPVDRVTVENGAMGYVVGSHRWNQTFKLSDFVTKTSTFPEIGGIDLAGLDDLPPIDAEADRFDIRYFDAEPGDVIVHHWATLHGSSGNISASSIRRAASIRYAGDDVTFLRRASSPEPFRNTVDLEDGASLDGHPRFPRVWP